MAFNKAALTPEVVTGISDELKIVSKNVEATIKLLLDDCTVPFIARYRKEVTGTLDEVQIRDIRDKFEYAVALMERKEAILRSINEQGKLTPELKDKIQTCKSKSVLEDLYLPYKPKKRTRAQIAKERGLEALALEILKQDPTLEDLVALATPYIAGHEEVKTLEIALQGAKDYIAEVVSETAEVRGEVRQWTLENALFRSEVRDEFKEQKTKFSNYYDFREPVKTVAPHRLMALRRGEKENVLKVTLEMEESVPLSLIENRTLQPKASAPVKTIIKEALADCYKRLLSPAIETELRLETKNVAEEEAISVFAKNLKNLLLLPPIPKRRVLGVDPGIRTGSKLVVVDETGKLLEYTTIYPDHDPESTSTKNKNSAEKLLELVKKHSVEYIAIGNGTGGREMETFIEKIMQAAEMKVRFLIVNEAGASVYSASDIAREEFPDLDLTIRGAVSIARRLQDPLAELVKIDPKSIGVGQYQHDVNQSKLKKSLEEVVESCVNYVGVDVNTASASLLGYVAGIGPSLAKNIVRHRDSNGPFKSRDALFQVIGYGPKAFEQSAGFMRVVGSENPLDSSAVHPESYSVVQKMAADLAVDVPHLLGNKDLLTALELKKYVTDEIGLPTLEDIKKELLKPGRDPREDGVKHKYNRDVKEISQLKEGQIVEGTVTNVTNFGAFVDIGVHQDGLIHLSELSNTFVKNAAEVISVGDQVKVKVIGVDKERKRISLSKKQAEAGPVGTLGTKRPEGAQSAAGSDRRSSAGGQRFDKGAPKKPAQPFREHKPKEPEKPASLSDLLNKFNTRRV